MTDLPGWSYTGFVPLRNDLSVLESALHTGRVSAAELGYTGEPRISTEQVVLTSPADSEVEPSYATAEDAAAAGLEFAPTHIRFQMAWSAEG